MTSLFGALARKELAELRRDRRYLGLAVGLPLVLLLLFGYAASLDVNRVPTAIYNLDGSEESLDYLSAFMGSGYFSIVATVHSYDEIGALLDRGKIDCALIIPPDFAARLLGGERARVQVFIDGSFPNTAAIIQGYVDALNAAYVRQLVVRHRARGPAAPVVEPVAVEARVWFNPSLKSVYYMVPGLFAVILMAFPPLLSALSIVRERERGSFKQLLMAAVSAWDVLLGKLIPYALIAFVDMLVILVVGTFWFHVPFRGRLELLIIMSFVYVLATVGIGLFISTFPRSQLAAMLLALVATMLPSFLYSGFLFPISSMSPDARLMTYLFPARYFVSICRGIYLKGIGLGYLWPEALILLIYTALVLALTAWRLRRMLR